MRGLIALFEPYSPAAAGNVQIRVGVARNSNTLRLDGHRWQTAISRAPRFAMEFLDDDITGKLMVGRGDMVLNATRLRGVTGIPDLVWPGANCTVWSGDGPAMADMHLEFSGKVLNGVMNKDSGQIPLTLEVNRRLVDVPMLNLEYGGGGGADGDTEVRGQLKPAAFGQPVAVEVFFFDQVNQVGQIDAYGNVLAIDELFEDGGSFGPKEGDYASYAALVAADLAEGTWATCIAEGMIRLGAPPRGVITCDPLCGGATPGTLALRWLQVHAGVSSGLINLVSFADFDDEIEAALGHMPPVDFWTQTQVNVLERLQKLAASCNSVPLLNLTGMISISRVFGGAVELEIDRFGPGPKVTAWRSFDPTTPWWRLKMSAARTYRLHTDQEIDYEDDIRDLGDFDPLATYRIGNVVRQPTNGIRYLYTANEPSAGNAPPDVDFWEVYEDAPDASTVKYLDGVPIEALKPAQAGADVTGSNTAAAIVGQGVLATDDFAVLGTGGTIKRQDGVTAVTDATAITALGTAAAITGQGVLATENAVYFGGPTLKESDGVTTATQLNFKTSLGTAAAITGQGSLATANAADYATQVTGIERPDNFAASDNLFANAGMATSSSGWALSGTAARVTAVAGDPVPAFVRFAQFAGFATAIPNNNTPIPCREGDRLFADAWVRFNQAGGFVSRNTFFFVSFWRADGTAISTSTLSIAATAAGAWQKKFSSVVAPAQTAKVTGGLSVNNNGAAGDTIDIGGLRLARTQNAATLGAIASTDLFRSDGVTVMTQAEVRTPEGTAAAIVSQGAFATLSETYFGDGRLKETSGGATATLSVFKTSLGTASAITSQGALATLGQVNLGAGGRVYRDDGTTRVTDALAITSIGTAAAITSQGAFATLSETWFGDGRLKETSGGTTATLSVFKTALGTASAIVSQGALATLGQVNLGAGGRVYRDDGVTRLTDTLAVTALGTAAAITSQGALATMGSVDLETAFVTNKTRISKLVAATGIAADSTILPANTLYGLLPSLRDAVTLSDTANGGTCTINIGASVYYPDVGGTITFPSGSVAGLTYATKYFIKRTGVNAVTAPTGTGWNASTTLSIGVGDVLINTYTTRATSGSPSPPPPPPPGDPDCVAADAWVETRDRGFVRANEIVAGDMLRVLTDDRLDTRWEPCTSNHIATAPAVRLNTARGFALACAETTPITLRDGSSVFAPEAAGELVPVFDSRLEWEACTVEPIGEIEVAHIRCSMKTYAAGDVAGRSILTHNPAKP